MDNDPRTTITVPALSPAAMAALYRGNKIEGIKIVREERNIGLKEAKDAVEAFLASQPSLQSTIEAAQSESKQGFWLWLVITIASVIVAYSWLLTP